MRLPRNARSQLLEAAHIRPFSIEPEHYITNGVLLRSDLHLHRLFDSGYMTITAEYRAEVSHRIREDFDNGDERGGLIHVPWFAGLLHRVRKHDMKRRSRRTTSPDFKPLKASVSGMGGEPR